MQRKVWGATECLLETPTVQIHRIAFLEGGTCSKHAHVHRWNAFYVLEGELIVEMWDLGPREDTVHGVILKPGGFVTVKPGLFHRFTGQTMGRALEIYYPAALETDDIVRLTEGFIRR